jgi:hypothetical protein
MERRAEQRQVAVAFDPPQSRFDGLQSAGDPALFLVRRAPRSTLSVTWPNWALSDSKQFVAFRLTLSAWRSPSRCSLSASSKPSSKLAAAEVLRSRSSWRSRPRAALCLGIRRPLVGLLQPAAPGRLLGLRQIPDDVLALVPPDSVGPGPGLRTLSESPCAAPWPLLWCGMVVVGATITAPHRGRFVNFQLNLVHPPISW